MALMVVPSIWSPHLLSFLEHGERIHKRQWLMDKNHETNPKDRCLFFIPTSFEFFLYTGMSGLALFFQDHDLFGMKDTLVFILEYDKISISSHNCLTEVLTFPQLCPLSQQILLYPCKTFHSPVWICWYSNDCNVAWCWSCHWSCKLSPSIAIMGKICYSVKTTHAWNPIKFGSIYIDDNCIVQLCWVPREFSLGFS